MSDSSVVLQFTDGRDGLWIELVDRPVPDADSHSDRDPMVARVRVQAGAFRGAFTTFLASYELLNLLWTLDAIWGSFGQPVHASFSNLEGTIRLTFQLTKTGQLQMTVDVRESPERKASLQFVVETEYMRLQHWMTMIRDALNQFPL